MLRFFQFDNMCKINVSLFQTHFPLRAICFTESALSETKDPHRETWQPILQDCIIANQVETKKKNTAISPTCRSK
jgi:hypothetical protein